MSGPRILGALLDAVAVALRRVDRVRLPYLPRIADFAVWVTAAEVGLGWSEGTFLAAYAGNRAEANALALEASVIAPAICDLAEQGDWTGTASDLLRMLNEQTDEITRRQKGWPSSPEALGNALTRIAPNLRAVGVEVERTRTGRRRLITVRKVGESTVTTVIDARGAVLDTGFRGDGGGDSLVTAPGNGDSSVTVPGGRGEPSKICESDGGDGYDGHSPQSSKDTPARVDTPEDPLVAYARRIFAGDVVEIRPAPGREVVEIQG